MMIEQPLDYDDIRDHARLQRRIATPICLDESIHTVRAADGGDRRSAPAASSTSSRAASAAMRESIRLHDSAAAHGIPVWHGGMLESGIGRAHNIHLSTLPNFSLPGDVAASRRYFAPDLIEPGDRGAAPTAPIAVPDRARASASRSCGPRRAPPPERVLDAALTHGLTASRPSQTSWDRSCERLDGTLAARVTPAWPRDRLAAWRRVRGCAPHRRAARAAVRLEQKMAWILRLEDQRILRDPAAPPPPPPPGRKGTAGAGRPPPPPLVAARSDRARSPTPTRASAAAPRWRSAASGCRKACAPLDARARRHRSRGAADGGVRAGADRRRVGRAGAADGAGRHVARRARPRRRSARA